jgi:hypothetical protein
MKMGAIPLGKTVRIESKEPDQRLLGVTTVVAQSLKEERKGNDPCKGSWQFISDVAEHKGMRNRGSEGGEAVGRMERRRRGRI